MKAMLLHGLVEDSNPVLGPTLSCADEQNPHYQARLLSGTVHLFHDGELRIRYQGRVYAAILCDGCLEAVFRTTHPAGVEVAL